MRDIRPGETRGPVVRRQRGALDADFGDSFVGDRGRGDLANLGPGVDHRLGLRDLWNEEQGRGHRTGLRHAYLQNR